MPVSKRQWRWPLARFMSTISLFGCAAMSSRADGFSRLTMLHALDWRHPGLCLAVQPAHTPNRSTTSLVSFPLGFFAPPTSHTPSPIVMPPSPWRGVGMGAAASQASVFGS